MATEWRGSKYKNMKQKHKENMSCTETCEEMQLSFNIPLSSLPNAYQMLPCTYPRLHLQERNDLSITALPILVELLKPRTSLTLPCP
jgi:hypothetical protein